jgi:hypothetical protein
MHGNSRWTLAALVVAVLLGLGLGSAVAQQVSHGISAGLLKVDQLVYGNNSNTNIVVNPLISINDFRPVKGDFFVTNTISVTNIIPDVSTNIYTTNWGYLSWNTADYYVQIGSDTTDDINGVLISSIAQNGRTNGLASITNYYAAPFFDESFGSVPNPNITYYPPLPTNGFRICTQVPLVAGTAGSGVEVNVNVAGAWFPFDKYIGGWARNSTRVNGGTMDLLRASPGLVWGTHFIEYGIPDGSGGIIGGGQFGLDLRPFGINSQTDGILLVNHAKDENNMALSKAEADGTWRMYVHDIGTGSASSYEQDPIAFVYIPRTAPDLVSGKINGDASIAMYSGSSPQFTVTKVATGRYTLKMNSYAATNGVLILSAEGGGTYNLDNEVCYQVSADGLSWELQSRDMPNCGLQSPFALIGGVQYPEAAFSFVFIPAPAVGFVVTPTANLLTTESGGTATFTVQLNAKPAADVTISGINSSDTTEGTVVGPTTLVFNTTNWYLPQTVTVAGVDDGVVDGEVPYTIVLPAATSADTRFNGLKASDVGAINADNEAGITLSANSLITTESGGTATFTVVLTTAPTGDVTLGLSSSDLTEGTVSPASLTFTSGNWNVPQTVTVTGVGDSVVDGNVTYTIVTGTATSTDAAYNLVNALDVSVVNLDNDKAGLTISPAYTTLTVSEPATTTNFTVALSCQPAANVTVSFTSSDTTEGTVSPASRMFTPANWSTPQTFTLTAVDDFVSDGTVAYNLNGTVSSTDTGYNGLTSVIAAQTLDNEALLTLPSGTLYYGIGWPGLGIDGLATISDPTRADYNTGSLRVSLTVNGTSNDRLEIRNTGTDIGQIGVSGSTVSYGGTPIGTFSGGTGTSPLVIALNSSANPESAQALARNITYRSVTNTPVLDPRTVVFTLLDGDGGTSAASKQIVVSKLHISDFQQGKDAGFGVYNDAHDCEIYKTVDANQTYPSGTYSDTNGFVGIVVHEAKTTLTGYDEQMLVRFDNIIGTNPGQIPPGATLVQADLLLTVLNSGHGSPLYRMKIPWNDPESWNSLVDGVQIDGNDAETNYFAGIGAPNHAGTTGAGSDLRVSVLADVQAWVNGTNNYGWVLPGWGVYTNNDNTIFAPAEATNIVTRPRLLVTWLPAEATIKAASFRQGVNSYTNTVDTRVRQISPDSQFSTVTAYAPDYEVSGFEDAEHVLIRFDNIFGTGAGQVPPLAKIHAAILDLTSTNSDNAGDGATINRMLIPWVATNTWNYFVEGIQADDVEAALIPTVTAGSADLAPNVPGGWPTLDVTSDVQLWANGTANYGWVFLPWPYGTDGWGIASSKFGTVASRPQLRVYYSYTAAVMLTPVVSPGNVQVKFAGEIGKTYEVVRSPAVGTGVTWTKVGEATVDEGGTATFVDNSPLPNAAYYRARTK